jgi:hypothetical protein
MLPRKFRTLAIALFLFQFGFQIESVSKYLLFSERYVSADTEGLYEQPETIEFVSGSPRSQALVVTPTRCLVDCYNDHDFIRPPMQTGHQLVVAAWSNGERVETDDDLDAVFVDWSTIRLRGDPVSSRGAVADLTLVLNQAYHPLWTSDAGEVTRGADGNLVVESISREEMGTGVELRFYDPASVRGVSISKTSWGVAAILAALLGPLWLATRPRSPRRRLETSPPPAGARGSWS